jgi:hypothetical protein
MRRERGGMERRHPHAHGRHVKAGLAGVLAAPLLRCAPGATLAFCLVGCWLIVARHPRGSPPARLGHDVMTSTADGSKMGRKAEGCYRQLKKEHTSRARESTSPPRRCTQQKNLVLCRLAARPRAWPAPAPAST